MQKESMSEWRFLRGWSREELHARLDELSRIEVDVPRRVRVAENHKGWACLCSHAELVRRLEPGLSDLEIFEVIWQFICNYKFSDKRIASAYFDPSSPLDGRNLLLELSVFGLHFLCGVRINAVRERVEGSTFERGFRYETLLGHMESGAEWFILRMNRTTGQIDFRISAAKRPGYFPNWWSHLGFLMMGRHFRVLWHKRAYQILRKLTAQRLLGVTVTGQTSVVLPDDAIHLGTDCQDCLRDLPDPET